MKQYKVIYTPVAEASLGRIFEDLESPRAAATAVRKILAKCDALAVFPGEAAVWQKMNGEELRLMRVGHYTVIYYIHEKEGMVTIHDVVYSRRDIAAML